MDSRTKRFESNSLFPSFELENNNFRHRITEETIEAVFRWILDEAESAGALSLAEVNADREAYGKKLLDEGDGPPKTGGKKRDNTSKKKLARRKKAAKGQKR
ncbi:hypothetical protein [uncultured Oscillibacter sp.]|nr:hypothetical protein [uncultured Oscillibacter sp.]